MKCYLPNSCGVRPSQCIWISNQLWISYICIYLSFLQDCKTWGTGARSNLCSHSSNLIEGLVLSRQSLRAAFNSQCFSPSRSPCEKLRAERIQPTNTSHHLPCQSHTLTSFSSSTQLIRVMSKSPLFTRVGRTCLIDRTAFTRSIWSYGFYSADEAAHGKV